MEKLSAQFCGQTESKFGRGGRKSRRGQRPVERKMYVFRPEVFVPSVSMTTPAQDVDVSEKFIGPVIMTRTENLCGGPATGGTWYEPVELGRHYTFRTLEGASDHSLVSAMYGEYKQDSYISRAAAVEWLRRYPEGRDSRHGSKPWALDGDSLSRHLLSK